VAEEAGELAATLGTEEWVDGDARSEAAMALAPVDLAAARALIDGLSGHAESYASMAQHGMVILIAGVDPEQAEALIEEWKLQGGDGQLAAVAWAMAAVDLERALAFARGIRDQGERGYALACVGLRLADDDRARAFDLVDEGMGEAAAETSRIAYDLGRTGEMGTMVAWAGLEAGHPDMQGLVLRAMSLRPDAGQATRGRTPDGSPAPDNRLEMRAKALAFVDVPAARQVIESLLMGLPAVATGRSGYHYVHMWVGPAAVADPEWTLEFARGLPDDEPGGEAKLKLWVYRRLADVLAMTDEEQLDDVLDYWAPGTPAM